MIGKWKLICGSAVDEVDDKTLGTGDSYKEHERLYRFESLSLNLAIEALEAFSPPSSSDLEQDELLILF